MEDGHHGLHGTPVIKPAAMESSTGLDAVTGRNHRMEGCHAMATSWTRGNVT